MAITQVEQGHPERRERARPARPLVLLEQFDDRLRDQVRRAAIDPQRDTAAVRRLAEGIVREHDRRSLTGEVGSLDDPASVVDELVARLSGFGPLQPLLDDPEIEENCTS